MLDKIQIYIAIVAAMVVLIVGIVENMALPWLTVRLIWIIIFFYFSGLIIRNYLKTKVFPQPETTENNDEKSNTSTEGKETASNATEDDEDYVYSE